MKKILLTAVAAVSAVTAFAQAPAFPGAEGHGRYVTGGRGGKIVHVTNLNDSGTGSLRWALSQSGKKTIVFDVGGRIDLNSDLKISSNTTIAGQTAPGEGITLCYYTLNFESCDNVIVRFIRVRRGQGRNINDGADAAYGRHHKNIIIDHCSLSWGIDECASFYDNQNFTLQWSTVAESLNNAGHSKGAHGYGGIWGGKNASFHHNLLAHHTNRSPRLNGARYGWLPDKGHEAQTDKEIAQTIKEEVVDLRNCVIYNWGTGNGAYGGMGGFHNIVNNYYKYGKATKNKYRVFQISHTEGKDDEALPAGIYGHFYISGNYVRDKGANYDWAGITIDDGNSTVEDTIKLDEPVNMGEITTHSAEIAYEKVLAYAGASYARDAIDARYAEEARTGTTTYSGKKTELPGIIDTQKDVGGYPVMKETSREAGFDSDNDGMPDYWETANGLNPNDASDANTYTLDTERGWYTNIEVYLNSLVEPIIKAQNADALSAVDEYYPACSPATGITNAPAVTSEIEKIEYYTLDGAKVNQPVKGINIRKITYTNGKVETDKVIK